jgi:hypothetical protein
VVLVDKIRTKHTNKFMNMHSLRIHTACKNVGH